MADIEQEQIAEGEKSNSFWKNTRCSFCFPCFGSRSSATVGLAWWERIGSSRTPTDKLHHHHDHQHHRWWSRGVQAFKKIREWSELVAGPKWKTFIRRFNRNRSGSGNSRHGRFQYDPLSYAMNFDNGPAPDEEDSYSPLRNFSTRYASISASGRPFAMDAQNIKDVTAVSA